MSWVENIKSGLSITTGDGKVYNPLYMITTKSVDYNVAEFEFPNITGTLVKRNTAKGARYRFELIFQGEDHIEQFKAFELSNNDQRPWQVFHPIYGNLLLQPTSLIYDPTGLNNTKVTGELIETITEEYPKITIDPKDSVGFDVVNVNEIAASSFESLVIPDASDVRQLANNTTDIYNLGAASIKSGDQSNDYFSLFTKAQSDILFATANAGQAMTSIINVINYPSLFVDSIKNRLTLLRNQFNKLSTAVSTLTTPSSKTIYQTHAGALVTASINTAINPQPGDYNSSNDVFDVITSVISLWNQYVQDLDTLQTVNGGNVNSFVPGFNYVFNLSNLVNFAISQLFVMSLTAKQERILYLESDSNVILLTHRFYGIDESNDLIDTFINQNNIGLSEMLEIKKGRKIIYYV